ncbi:hypothetical protein MASR1M101_23460 [Gemmatimonas sp.]
MPSTLVIFSARLAAVRAAGLAFEAPVLAAAVWAPAVGPARARAVAATVANHRWRGEAKDKGKRIGLGGRRGDA